MRIFRISGEMTGAFVLYKNKNHLEQMITLNPLETLRALRKPFKKNRIRAVYDSRILKIVRILRKLHKRNRLRMVFSGSAYKSWVISCFFGAGTCAISFGFFPSHFHFLSSLPWAFLVGGAVNSAKTDDKPNENSSNENENRNNTRSEKPGKRHENRIKTNANYLKSLFPEIDKIIELPGSEGPALVVYVRVSSLGQVLDGKSLEYQEEQLINIAKKIEASVIYVIRDEGKSGRDFVNRKLGTILQLAAEGKIQRLLVSEIDRAGRDAFELLSFLFQLRRYGVIIQTPDGTLDVKNLANLIILAVKSVGAEDQVVLRGFGSMRTKVGNFQKREWNRPIPLGYTPRKPWIMKAPGWEAVIHDVFELFLEFKEYEAVCKMVNKLHGDFLMKNLKNLLKPPQVKAILENPVYMGKPQLFGEATQKNFGKVIINDSSIAYVDEVTFQKVQKIIQAIDKEYGRREKPIEEIAKIFGADALRCLPHVAVLCPRCETKMTNDGSPGYICPKCDKHRTGLKKTELAAIRDYLLVREKCMELAVKWSKKFKWSGLADKKWKILERLLKKIRNENGKEKAKKEANGGDKN